MPIKNKIFSVYLIGVIILIIMPLNVKKEIINSIYIFNLRLDYIFHVLIFSLWMFVKKSEKYNPLFWIIIGLIFAFLAEGIQFFIPYRNFSEKDLIANCLGIVFSYFIYHLLIFYGRFSHKARHRNI